MRALLVTFGLISCAMAVLAVDQRKSKTHTVAIEGMRFQPEMLTVERGDTIVWTNKDLVPHTATSTAGSFDSKLIEADKSWKFTVRKKGDFAYICTFHPTLKAMLQVE